MKKCQVNPCLLGPCTSPESCNFYHEPPGISEERQAELSKDCDAGTVIPFSNGTQFIDWQALNCDRCTKRPDELKPGLFLCELDYCLGYACIAAGKISQAIADRLGYKPGAWMWKCPECQTR